jgi:hypothetical protein
MIFGHDFRGTPCGTLTANAELGAASFMIVV